MKLLSIDSSGLTATAAVYADGVIKAASSVNNKKTHSQTLLPMIERVLYEAELTINDMESGRLRQRGCVLPQISQLFRFRRSQ